MDAESTSIINARDHSNNKNPASINPFCIDKKNFNFNPNNFNTNKKRSLMDFTNNLLDPNKNNSVLSRSNKDVIF